MTKEELIVAIEKSKNKKGIMNIFANFLIEYLTNLQLTTLEVEKLLPHIVIDAYEHLRTGSEKEVAAHRALFEVKLNNTPMVDIISVDSDDAITQQYIKFELGSLIKRVIVEGAVDEYGEWLKAEFLKYCNAQSAVLQQHIDRFSRLVYRRGMCEYARECSIDWTEIILGTTILKVANGIGITQFIFERSSSDPDKAMAFSFSIDEKDPTGYSAGIRSVHTDLTTCIAMIEDVINNWPSEKSVQAALFEQ